MPDTSSQTSRNRDAVITIVFQKHFVRGSSQVPFTMDEIRDAIAEVRRRSPSYKEKNVADVRYAYTSGRQQLPITIDKHGPWMIEGRGKGLYAFVKLLDSPLVKSKAIWLRFDCRMRRPRSYFSTPVAMSKVSSQN